VDKQVRDALLLLEAAHKDLHDTNRTRLVCMGTTR
jgi:hypothetical protein